jgi:glycerol-3-phosphate dehydrogenase
MLDSREKNSSVDRQALINALSTAETWDLIVIGGGATGLGTALEAVTRGLKTVLVEQYDFAKGTSSRSTKLVHGGVRYLAQGNLSLVRDALRERGLLRQNAPHLVQDLPFVVPSYRWGETFYYGTGLKLYDLLAGQLGFGIDSGFGNSRRLSRAEAIALLPTLNPNHLNGGILYHDGQFDDARLAIALCRTILDYGGLAVNYVKVTGLLKAGDRAIGVQACDQETGDCFELKAKAIVNATGVFVDRIRQLDQPGVSDLVSPSQGIHLVMDAAIQPGQAALMIPKTEDKRVLFAVPWHGKVVVGTTDTPVDTVQIEPRPLASEIDFILRTAAKYLVQVSDRPEHLKSKVLSIYAGLRPLVKASASAVRSTVKSTVKSTAKLSREHTIDRSVSGLITVTGGKWTTYRQMGEDVVDQVFSLLNQSAPPSQTAQLKLHGWTEIPGDEPLRVYGSDGPELLMLPGATTLIHPRLPYSEAEVRWAVRYELARTVEDVLARRTRALLLDAIASVEASARVAEIMAAELGEDVAWQQRQVEEYEAIAKGYFLA